MMWTILENDRRPYSWELAGRHVERGVVSHSRGPEPTRLGPARSGPSRVRPRRGHTTNPLPVVSNDVHSACLRCRSKGYLKLAGAPVRRRVTHRSPDRPDPDNRAAALARPQARPG
jgi:hypothetical protein